VVCASHASREHRGAEKVGVRVEGGARAMVLVQTAAVGWMGLVGVRWVAL